MPSCLLVTIYRTTRSKKNMNSKSVDHKSYLNAFIVFSIDKKLIKITGYLFLKLYSFEYFVGNPFSIIVVFLQFLGRNVLKTKHITLDKFTTMISHLY